MQIDIPFNFLPHSLELLLQLRIYQFFLQLKNAIIDVNNFFVYFMLVFFELILQPALLIVSLFYQLANLFVELPIDHVLLVLHLLLLVVFHFYQLVLSNLAHLNSLDSILTLICGFPALLLTLLHVFLKYLQLSIPLFPVALNILLLISAAIPSTHFTLSIHV